MADPNGVAPADWGPSPRPLIGSSARYLRHVGAFMPELAELRRSLRRWLDEAEATGLDEYGVAALFESTLRDFPERATETRSVQRRESGPGGAA